MGMGRSLSGLRPIFLHHARHIHLPYVESRKHGILAIEALAILAWCRVFDTQKIIESGVNNGRSTTYFRKAGLHVTSIDKDECDCDAHEFIKGRGENIIPQIVDGHAVFLDGPKRERALALARDIVGRSAFVACHDMAKRHGEFQWISSDDMEFLHEFRHLIDNNRYQKTTGLGVLWDDR